MAGDRLTGALRRIAAHPSWALDYWRGWQGLRSRGEASVAGRREFSLGDHPEALRDEPGAITELTGARVEDYEKVLGSAWFPAQLAGDRVPGWSRAVLLRTLAALVRLARPRVAIEVGVERGYSSAVILHAMEEAGTGRLHSIDIPPLREGPDFTGEAVAEALRDRWELVIGPSRRRLPELVARLERVDLFVHDGDHSYGSQREDLEAVWPRLAPGGLIVVDDVWTRALFDFADAHGQSPLVIERADSQDGVGLLRRS